MTKVKTLTRSCLVAPHDREGPLDLSGREVKLTEEEAKLATTELFDDTLAKMYPRVDKFFSDPIYNNQYYCLHSFVPARGAKPDKHGIYGFMKCRGSVGSIQEAKQRSDLLIREFDTYHPIQTAHAGRPFPVVEDTSKFIKDSDVDRIDLDKEIKETFDADIKEKRKKEAKEIKEIKEREEELLSTTGPDATEDPMDTYTTLNIKIANLKWYYVQAKEKMQGIRKTLEEAKVELATMDEQHPTFRDKYMKVYIDARRKAGFEEENLTEGFMKYLCSDIEID